MPRRLRLLAMTVGAGGAPDYPLPSSFLQVSLATSGTRAPSSQRRMPSFDSEIAQAVEDHHLQPELGVELAAVAQYPAEGLGEAQSLPPGR